MFHQMGNELVLINLLHLGIDGLIVENMNDTPYVKSKMLGPEIIAAMTATSSVVRSIFPQEKPVGIQILAGANCEALAVAKGTTSVTLMIAI